MDALASFEAEHTIADIHFLNSAAHEVHLDAAFQGIEDRFVTEMTFFTICTELAIDTAQKVQVE